MATVADVQGIHHERVSDWLANNIDGATPPFEFSLITGGRSNLTFFVLDAVGNRYVLRRPPTGHVLATAHDMAREHRIISAVGQTDVPVPRTLGLCTDESVNDAPFYVMSYVAGEVLDSPEKADLLPLELREPASHHLIDVLADLHDVDIDAIGLGDLARREGYIERQLKRWSTQWANSKTRDLPVVDDVGTRLSALIVLKREGPCITLKNTASTKMQSQANCTNRGTRNRIAKISPNPNCRGGEPTPSVHWDNSFAEEAWRGQVNSQTKHRIPPMVKKSRPRSTADDGVSSPYSRSKTASPGSSGFT